MERGPRSHCPVSLALEVIGDRWSLLILRDLMMREKSRYQEFLGSEERISTNILADRLARLEQRGLITKSDDPDDKRQFRYAPTRKALDLLPIIYEMGRWSAKYDPRTDVTNPLFQRMKAGKEGFIRQLADRFKGPDGGDASRRAHPRPRRGARTKQR
jgi:DNA-binding HxlR family transcriptional regulator